MADWIGQKELGEAVRQAKGADRWTALRNLYREIEGDILDQPAHVWACDPYVVDWVSLFTPIEFGIWYHIRTTGAVLYPQFPIDRYFADFAHPKAKIVIECDGAAFHKDEARDATRQRRIESLGYTVYRVPGWKCLEPDEIWDEDRQENVANPSGVGAWFRDIALRHGIMA